MAKLAPTGMRVHICEVDGYAYLLLPSLNKRLRDKVAEVAVPASAWRPAFRIPTEQLSEVKAAIREVYPHWEFWPVAGLPPWVENILRAERRAADKLKENMHTIEGGGT